MEIIGVIIAVVIFLTTAMQIGYVLSYGRVMKRAYHRVLAKNRQASQDLNLHILPATDTPDEVAVVLCLRGADPSLAECLQGIAKQIRQPFQLHIVVDDERDPAVDVVDRYLPVASGQRPFHCHVHQLPEIPKRGSLKCAALLTAIDKIPDHIEKIAFLDADTIPDETWLHDLIYPLSVGRSVDHSTDASTDAAANEQGSLRIDSNSKLQIEKIETFGWMKSVNSVGETEWIGATTGNRWFDPPTPSLGGYLRQIWNAAAVVQMALYNVAWGGSFALNRKTFRDSSLRQHWATAFCEDTMLAGQLKQNGIRLVRVPELVVVNRETTGIADASRWIVRQLLTVRLYHRGWPLVALHGLSTGVVSLVAPIMAVLCWLSDFQILALVIGLGWLIYQFVNAWLLRCITTWNQQLIMARKTRQSESIDSELAESEKAIAQKQCRIFPAPVIYMMAILLAQWVQPMACVIAIFARRVRWRGIEYKIHAGKKIELVRYHPISEIMTSEVKKTGKVGDESNPAEPRSIT